MKLAWIASQIPNNPRYLLSNWTVVGIGTKPDTCDGSCYRTLCAKYPPRQSWTFGRKTLKTPALFTLCMLAALRLGAGPSLSAPAEVYIRDHKFDLVITLSDPAEIKIIMDAIRRASVIPVTVGGPPLSHKIDLKDRWLYDVSSGRLMLLSNTEQSTYQLLEPDRTLLEAIINRKEK